ncbi:hypothetical protein BRD09_01670 [Halobacteriales archaeon SW_10_68_16]|nr:MAG: hypothetical protein BRD09_01670 [Halobacteriales archaeon SW_10_68_16]
MNVRNSRKTRTLIPRKATPRPTSAWRWALDPKLAARALVCCSSYPASDRTVLISATMSDSPGSVAVFPTESVWTVKMYVFAPAAGRIESYSTSLKVALTSSMESSVVNWTSTPPVNSIPGSTGTPVIAHHAPMTASATTSRASGTAASWRFEYCS